MSSKGIYTAVSGAIAQNAKLETIANNIANANTPAFKRDAQIFREYLASYEKTPEVIEAPRVPSSIESFYNMNGGDKSYVDSNGTFTDFQQGAIKQTNNSLDMALDGPGFFEILTPQGVRYTRAGNFSTDAEGRLVTKDGHTVLSAGDPFDLQARIIKFASGFPVVVKKNGEILQNEKPVAKLSVVNTSNVDAMEKVGANNYKLREGIANNMTTVVEPDIFQGALETSNVNIVKEMTDMIGANRTFESLQKTIQAFDQMDDKLINQLPR